MVGDADARADEQRELADLERLAERREDLLAQRHGGTGIVAVEQEQEFVAAQAGEQVARTAERSQALGHCAQQQVADIVAKAVVDAFEMVQVEEQQGQRLALGEQVVEPDEQVGAAGYVGQLVEIGQVVQALFGAFAVADVAQQEQIEALAGPLERRAGTFQHEAVAVAQGSEFMRAVRLGKQARPGFGVAEQLVRSGLDQFDHALVEQPAGGRVGIHDAPLGIDDQHGHRGGADQVAQQLFAFAQGGLIAHQLLGHAVEVGGQLADFVQAADLGLGLAVAGGEAQHSLPNGPQSASDQPVIEQVEDHPEQQ